MEIEVQALGIAQRAEEADGVGPGELTETQLEALLFVAEKPLTRGEIAALAGVDRETVNARVGDLAVSLGGRGIRSSNRAERVESPPRRRRAPDRAIRRRRRAAPLDPSLETLAIVAYRQPCTRATIERIREWTRTTPSNAPSPPADRGAGSLGTRPPDPVRHRLRLPGALRMTSLEDLPPMEAPIAERLFRPDAMVKRRRG